MTNTHLTRTIARLLRDAAHAGASADVVADVWALRAMPLEQQVNRIPEWRQVRDEWRAAGLLSTRRAG